MYLKESTQACACVPIEQHLLSYQPYRSIKSICVPNIVFKWHKNNALVCCTSIIDCIIII